MAAKSTAKLFQNVENYDLNHTCIKSAAFDRYFSNTRNKKFNMLLSIWKNYLTIGYYVCVIPFKPVYNDETSRWQLQTRKLQQVMEKSIYGIKCTQVVHYGRLNFCTKVCCFM